MLGAVVLRQRLGVSGDVVFAGYGLVVPNSQNFGYDSYQGLDVKDKIVVVLRYFPEDADQKTRAILARYADLRYKAQAARQRGAKGMIVVTGPRSPNAGNVVPMSFDTAIAGSGLVAVSVSGDTAAPIFKAANKQLEAVQKELDGGNPHVAGFAIPNLQVTLDAKIIREQQTGNNVVALPAGDRRRRRASMKPWVAVGAHYDHLGRGGAGNSLADKEELNQIHHGADDNASGTATVLNIADALAKQPRKRNLLIGFWSGEELGLLGSNAFVTKPPVPLDQVAAYLNFDMVGRVSDNKLTVQATGTSAMWPKLLEQANVAAGFDLVLQEDPYQPTDVGSFNTASVACLTFFTGAHQEYHKPSDTADKINYEDLDRVGEFATAIVKRLMDANDAPQFTKVEQKTDTGGRAGLRLFTGTIPDYATDVKGLLLGGVIGGGPAEQAGLAEGRRDHRDRRPVDHQHLRLHLRARAAEDRPAGEGRLHARQGAARDHAHARGAQVDERVCRGRADRTSPGQGKMVTSAAAMWRVPSATSFRHRQHVPASRRSALRRRHRQRRRDVPVARLVVRDQTGTMVQDPRWASRNMTSDRRRCVRSRYRLIRLAVS